MAPYCFNDYNSLLKVVFAENDVTKNPTIVSITLNLVFG